jgi:hypothetical protein
VIEELETRRFLSVVTLPNQWSVFTQDTSNGRKIYVDNTAGVGSDSNSGLDPDHPVATLAKAKSLMRDGHPDWMLLKRGDTWNEPIGVWTKSGSSQQNPMIISYYGVADDPFNPGFPVTYDLSSFPDGTPNLDPRPLVNSGVSDGINFQGTVSHVAVVGIQFKPLGPNNPYNGKNSTGVTGIRAQLTGSDFLVEDCLFQGFKDDVVIGNPDTPVDGFIIRRSEILDAYNKAGAHAQGLYASGSTNHLTIEENVFDHNGWKDDTDKTVFNHNMYINTGAQNVLVRANVSTRASLRGVLLRAGGTVQDNFLDQNAVAVQVGNTASVVTGNVILQGVDLPSLASGVGIDVAFSVPSVDVENNIIAHDQSAYTYNLSGINLNGGTNNATVKGNTVYDWRRTLINGVTGGNSFVQNNSFEDFDGYHPLIKVTNGGNTTYGNNNYYSAVPSTAFQEGSARESYGTWLSHNSSDGSSTNQNLLPYTDPNRDMGTYNGSLGGTATFTAWVTAQRAQSRETWNSAYTAAAENAYIAAGFNKVTTQQQPPKIDVIPLDPNASEMNLDPGTFRITRTGTAAQLLNPVTVNYDLSGSATFGSDYALFNTDNSPFSQLFFPAATGGATSQSIDVVLKPIGDSLVEGDETAKFSIRGSTDPVNPSYILGTNPSAVITISDMVTSVNVQAPIDTASEDGPVSGQFTLTRSGPTTNPLIVNLLWSGEAHLIEPSNLPPSDFSVIADPSVNFTKTYDATGNLVGGSVMFPAGASSIDLTIAPVQDGQPDGGYDDSTDPPTPIYVDESVGLTVLPSTDATPAYVPGVSDGATVTILDQTQGTGGGGDGGGGTGGDTNPPPLGHGLYEAYINSQDTFIPDTVFGTQMDSDALYQAIHSNTYGPVAFEQVDGEPGFNFAGSTGHPGVGSDHFSTLWTGEIQPQYGEKYTLYLNIDGDASAKLYIQDDIGVWHLITKTNDTDPTKTSYTLSNYFTHRIADANDDAQVNTLDFNMLASHFNQQTGATWASGDFNADGKVNALDFNTLATNFGMADPRPASHEISGSVDWFEAGGRYNVAIEYSDKVGLAKIRFLWSSSSRPKQEVPLDRLYASASASPALGMGLAADAFTSPFSSTEILDSGTTDLLG